MADKSTAGVKARVTLERFDRSGDTTIRLEEVVIDEKGVVVSRDAVPRPATEEEVAALDRAAKAQEFTGP